MFIGFDTNVTGGRTDGRTDGRTPRDDKGRVYAKHRAAKTMTDDGKEWKTVSAMTKLKSLSNANTTSSTYGL